MFFIKKRFKIKTIIVAILIVLIVIIFYDNKHLQITHYTYISDKITSDLEGLRIVQISDLHNTAFGKDNKRLIQKITEKGRPPRSFYEAMTTLETTLKREG